MWPEFYETGTVKLGYRPPLPVGYGMYALLDTLGTDTETDQERFEAVIAKALEDGVIQDAVIAQSGKESEEFWRLRDSPSEYRRVHWPQLSFDISLPTGQIDDFVVELRDVLHAKWPGIRTIFFGHIADGNLHLSAKTAEDPLPEDEMEELVYSTVGKWKGSVSAEHGIGMHKVPYLHYSRSPEELAVMRAMKTALDPKGILNPRKVIG
jgi:FAD/FMN-containing dehydrogenase